MAKKDTIKKAQKKAQKQAAKVKTKAEPACEGCPTFKNIAKKKLTTGKGASATEIGKSLVELFTAGKSDQVEKLWHHKKIESIEADGTVFLGRKGVSEKNAWWSGAFEVHSAKAEGPFVGATGFSVFFTIETSSKAGECAGKRVTMREIGVYTVSKGKIVREEFMCAPCCCGDCPCEG